LNLNKDDYFRNGTGKLGEYDLTVECNIILNILYTFEILSSKNTNEMEQKSPVAREKARQILSFIITQISVG